MVTCRITLHGDLPDLAGGRREHERSLPAPTSARDALAALGIPHCEIGAVLLDDRPATLALPIADGARLAAWPARPHALDEPRFLCDLHLGKLARLLRVCGVDTAWDASLREPALARLAVAETRTVISRHRALLKRGSVTSGLLIRANLATQQLAEVLRRFQLADRISRPGRCPACNGSLAATPKAAVPVPIPPRTAAWLDEYWLCSGCGQLFWEGTHVARLQHRIAAAIALATARDAPGHAGPRNADT
jgi:uncharacterized protein